MNYEIFLFDADGTLYDYNKAESNALKITFDDHGFSYTDDVLLKYREINSRVWKDFENGKISRSELQESRFNQLFNRFDITCDANEFNSKYLYQLGKGSFLIEGALELCKSICKQGKKIYIVTNGILATQTSRIKYSAITEYISDSFVSEQIGYNKPHQAYFDYVFSHIPPVDKSKILIIGDSLEIDIAGGNNAGIDTCWLNLSTNDNDSNVIPTYEINSLSELHWFIKDS